MAHNTKKTKKANKTRKARKARKAKPLDASAERRVREAKKVKAIKREIAHLRKLLDLVWQDSWATVYDATLRTNGIPESRLYC